MYSTNHRNPTPPSSSLSISDTLPGLVNVYASLSPLLVTPLDSAPPVINHVSPPPLALSHRYSTQSTSPNITVVVPVVLFLGLGVPHTFSRFLLSIIPSVILCPRTHLCCSLFLDMHVFAGEPIKTVNNVSTYSTVEPLLQAYRLWVIA